MPEGGGNKEIPNKPKEDDVERSQSGYSNNAFGVDGEEIEKYKNLYGKRRKRKQVKNMSNPEKNIHNQEDNPSITWPEMHTLLQPGKNSETEIKTKSLVTYVKILSTGSENRISIDNLDGILREGDKKLANGEYGEQEWALVGGAIDKKLTELRKAEKKKSMLKEVGSTGLKEEKDIPSFLKERLAKEKELGIIFKKNESELTEKDKQRTIEIIDSLYKRPLSEMDLSFFGSSGEKPPKVEEIGIANYKKWFEDKIHALVEDYPDQNFETNWTLTYTLQQSINNLWGKDGKDEFEYVSKSNNGQEILMKGSYKELRRELAEKLESYRAVHNFIYLYRRIPGISEAIGPAGLLEKKYLQSLLREKGVDKNGNEYGVADALRNFYEIGERYRNEEDDGRQKEIFKEAESLQSKDWQGRVAGALYSAFQGGARDGGLILNQGGDFFIGRLYNMPKNAKALWEDSWGRKPWPKLYEALDLKVDDFWEKTFKGFSEKQLNDLGVKIETINEKKINEQKVYRFKNAHFEKLDLINNSNVIPDHLKSVILSLDDADNIRKMILNPRGLLDEPKFAHITAMWEKFKHLKGEKRSEWFASVAKELVWFFRDKVAPWNENLPISMRKCPAQEVYPNINPMDDERLTDIVWDLTPPLTRKDAELVLNQAIGSKSKRVTEKTIRVAGSTVFSMILEGFKALFGFK